MTRKNAPTSRSKGRKHSARVEKTATSSKQKRISRKGHLEDVFVVPKDPLPLNSGERTYQEILEPLGMAAAVRSGDEYALGQLLFFATQATHCLNQLADEMPEIVRAIARQRAQWPVMCAAPKIEPHSLVKIADFLSKIELGAETSRKAASPEIDPWRQWSVPIIYFMELIRRRYEHFREDTNPSTEETDAYALKLAAHYARKLSVDLPFGDVNISLAWLKECAALPPYTKENFKMWARIASSLIDLNVNADKLRKTRFAKDQAVTNRANAKHDRNREKGSYEKRLRETIHEKFSRTIETDAPNALGTSGL